MKRLEIKVDKPLDHHKKTWQEPILGELCVEGGSFPSAGETDSFVPSDDGTMSLILT